MSSPDRSDKRHIHPRIRLDAEAYTNPDAIYFVTVCCHDSRPVFTTDKYAAAAVESVLWLRTAHKTRVFAFCVMPDHVHMLVSINAGDTLSDAVRAFKSVCRTRCRTQGFRDALWQDRFHDRILRSHDNGISVVEYILENPVRRRMVSHRAEYQFSGTPDVLDSSYRKR